MTSLLSRAGRLSSLMLSVLLVLACMRCGGGTDSTRDIGDLSRESDSLDGTSNQPDLVGDLDSPTDIAEVEDLDLTRDSTLEEVEDPGRDTEVNPDWMVAVDDTTWRFNCQGSILEIHFVDQAVVRIHYGYQEDTYHSQAVPDPQGQAAGIQAVSESEHQAVLSSDRLTVEVSGAGCAVRVLDQDRVIVEEPEGGGYLRTPGTATSLLERVTPPGERFYGFGEKTGGLNKRGSRMTFWNTDPLAGGDYTQDTDPIYQSIPFFIGLREGAAYGLFTDNTFRMEFDMARAEQDRYLITAYGGPMVQYVIAGPGVREVVEGYTALTGRMEMPPRWTLGYHQCRWSYYPAARVEEICDTFREKEIPADGIWLDIDYMDGFRSFTWNPVGFPDPSGLMSRLEAKGFKTTVIIDPGLKLDPAWDIYNQGLNQGCFMLDTGGNPYVGEVWPGEAVFPDFSDPEVRDWWGTLIPRVTDQGVRGLWIDMNEPASFLASVGHTVPNQVLANGDGHPTTMAEVHNLYAFNMARATFQGMKAAQPQRRPFILTRSGFAGYQRYTAMWTGDSPSEWPMLKGTLPMLMNLGLSGVAFTGSDVGGFTGGATPEMFARWLLVGSMTPFFRGHVATGTQDQEPWAFGIEVEDISRSAISTRYRLLPYIYSLFRYAHTRGEPLIRPLVYEFQEDPAVWDMSYEAMLGPWLLLAPVLEPGVTSHTFYLPPGDWFEFASGARFEGARNHTVDVSLAALPLFVRRGAIIPLSKVMMWSDQEPLAPLYLDIYPSASKTGFDLYEDAGDGMGYKQGDYALTRFELIHEAGTARLTAAPREGALNPPAREVRVRCLRVDHDPSDARLDGESLTRRDSPAFEGTGWYWDPRELSVLARFEDKDGWELELDYNPIIEDRPTVTMTFRVELPAETPVGDTIYIALSSNGWTQVPLGMSDGSGFLEGSVQVPRGGWFEYKYTRGDWPQVEVWSGCVPSNNRYAQGTAHPVKQDRVEAWDDLCP